MSHPTHSQDTGNVSRYSSSAPQMKNPIWGAAKDPRALVLPAGVILSPQLSTGRNSLRQKLLCQGCGAAVPGTSLAHPTLRTLLLWGGYRLKNPPSPEIITFHTCDIDIFL